MRFRRAAAALALVSGSAGAAERIEFVAIGDMPYGTREKVQAPYEHLIGQINALQPAFTVHVGDLKASATTCSDEEFAFQRANFERFASALVYTPGDNDWTDCHRPGAGRFDPVERLAKLREVFFPAPRTLGQRPFDVERQSAATPENVRFERADVLFVTLHVVGSNNNARSGNARAMAEFQARDAANVAWIRAAFERARAMSAQALVFMLQADPFQAPLPWNSDAPSGFAVSIDRTLLPLAEAWGRPVLFVHGDSHVFTVDRPFRNAQGEPVRNVVRLQVYGAPDMHAVHVTIEPSAPSPFIFRPVMNPMQPGP